MLDPAVKITSWWWWLLNLWILQYYSKLLHELISKMVKAKLRWQAQSHVYNLLRKHYRSKFYYAVGGRRLNVDRSNVRLFRWAKGFCNIFAFTLLLLLLCSFQLLIHFNGNIFILKSLSQGTCKPSYLYSSTSSRGVRIMSIAYEN